MKTVGIVCEYNPLHKGHCRQLRLVRKAFGSDCTIVCTMSGNFVQRGAPAILDKSIRAEAALMCGADLVLELPVTCALSSAEGFAAGAVRQLQGLCDVLCFGAETPEPELFVNTARCLLDPAFPPLLRQALDTGLSFPAARQQALEAMGLPALVNPNDILGVEYCKAILQQPSPMDIFPIHRPGSYHATEPDRENPSATALRQRMLAGNGWLDYVPPEIGELFASAPLHSLHAGQRAILTRLRTMTEEEFEALPYGSEGLWRKLMHASREKANLEEILTAVKSKRYTRSRLDRMVMCAFLGITRETLSMEIPYSRILGFSDRGRQLLNTAKKSRVFRNPGQADSHPYWELEKRCGDLYGLFCTEAPEAPGAEERRRICYRHGTP